MAGSSQSLDAHAGHRRDALFSGNAEGQLQCTKAIVPSIEATHPGHGSGTVEAEVQRITADLARSNAELLSYAYTVAHDLQEPLRTISAFTQLLVRKAQYDVADREIAHFIVEGVRRMSTLLHDLLASATRGTGGSPNRVELGDSVAEAMRNLREALTSSGAVVTVGPLPAVQGNDCDLVRLFQNLIGNAVKYRREAAVEVHIAAERAGPDWVVKIRDNGIGIPEEHHHRVFGLFTRLHADEIPGAGIGLAVCKKIVESLGGAIWVESEPKAGSTFFFKVPAQDDLKESNAVRFQ